MKTIVISQPMFFPWVGIFEQIRLSDIYVHFDDVQLPQGRSFINRVQIKAPQGSLWLTVPIRRQRHCPINQVITDNKQEWRRKHLKTLEQLYCKAHFFDDMMKIAKETYRLQTDRLSQINIFAIESICSYFGIGKEYALSSNLSSKLKKNEHLLELIKRFGCNRYITGHGAKNYLDYNLFEKNNVSVEYIDYKKKAYPQLYGKFNPHVTILDLIANCGKKGVEFICSSTVEWKEFLEESK